MVKDSFNFVMSSHDKQKDDSSRTVLKLFGKNEIPTFGVH